MWERVQNSKRTNEGVLWADSTLLSRFFFPFTSRRRRDKLSGERERFGDNQGARHLWFTALVLFILLCSVTPSSGRTIGNLNKLHFPPHNLLSRAYNIPTHQSTPFSLSQRSLGCRDLRSASSNGTEPSDVHIFVRPIAHIFYNKGSLSERQRRVEVFERQTD